MARSTSPQCRRSLRCSIHEAVLHLHKLLLPLDEFSTKFCRCSAFVLALVEFGRLGTEPVSFGLELEAGCEVVVV